ncbi:aldehyde dehydrogenase family protein [Citricoccus parietis]
METADTFEVFNPATDELVAQAPACSPEQLDRMVRGADEAFTSWRRDESARRELLRKAADALESHAERLGAIMTAEQGKPLPDSVGEVTRTAGWFRYYADLEVDSVQQRTVDGVFLEVTRQPLGVVAGIVPWNMPVLLIGWKAAPALLAGNTIIIKPSPFTPLTALAVGEIFAEVFPPNVFSVASGPDPLGSQLSAHPLVRKVSFTGSIETGKRVAASASEDLKRITLELGGNDAAIVLDDVEPERFASDLFWAAFKNNGQLCSLIKRLYVPRARVQDFAEAIATVARTARVGDGALEGTQIGPLATRPQWEKIKEFADTAIAQGAVAVTGGKPMEGPGNFFEPTVLINVTDGDRIVDEEQFGPIMPIIGHDGDEDALRRANAGNYGLGGSVWSEDIDRALDLARRFEAGQTAVNHHSRGIRPDMPFGGFKWSGIGVENGAWGYEAYTQLHAVNAPAK